MPYTAHFTMPEPTTDEVHALPGWTLLEFGTDWCPHCLGAQNAIREALDAAPGVQHIKIEDGPGRRLGRFYRVKLWPSLVLLRDGEEVGKAIRPQNSDEVKKLLSAATN